MATLAVTNSFSAGTTIVAADMNTNFDDIEAFVNTTPGVVQNDIVDVLGDLIVASGADAVSRLAAGTNNHVLTADSTVAAHGLKWAAAPTPTTITVADTTDTTCSVALFESATGDLAPKTDGGATYNAGTGVLTATGFAGPLTGAVTGNADTATTAGTVPTAAQGAITSVGTLSALTVTGAVTAGSVVAPLAINNETSSYTLVIGDAGGIVEMNSGSANNLTIPPNSSVAFATGTQIVIIQQGAGATTIVEGSGVTTRSLDDNAVINGQYVSVALVKRDTDEWYIFGNLTS